MSSPTTGQRIGTSCEICGGRERQSIHDCLPEAGAPHTYDKAVTSPYSLEWTLAVEEQLQAFLANGT